MTRARRLRYLTVGIIVYMVMALAWWSVLLFVKNQDAFDAKAELLRLGMIAEGIVDTPAEFAASEPYARLYRDYRYDNYQILGEATVFVLTLVVGVWLVNFSYRKEVEAARQQRNFLLSITHELKSPLAGIRLVLDTLRKRELTPPQLATLTSTGLTETVRLTGLVEDLLLSARLDTGYEPNLEPINLRELGDTWIQRLRGKYPDVKFHLNCEGREFTVLADQYGLTSALSNLLENSVKYLGAGSCVELRVLERGSDVCLVVLDDGIGIPEGERDKVLQKFYRVGNEDTRSTKGTGLGLYIVNEVVKAHAGSLDIRDNHPRGTVFELCLPFGEPD